MMLREMVMAGPAESFESDPLYRELKDQMDRLAERIDELEETVEGDDKGRWSGLTGEIERMREEQKKQGKILEAWQSHEEKRTWEQQRRDTFNRLFISGLSVISVILSILVAANTLTQGMGGP